ncbi:MAG: septum formation initiator family protein [Candidatus Falkowbacteria bacterium]
MKQSRHSGLISRFLHNQKVILVGLLFILGCLLVPVIQNYSTRQKVNHEIVSLENEIKANEKRKTDLEKFITYLHTNEFVEEQARLNLALKKPGETVLVVNNHNVSSSISQSQNLLKLIDQPDLKTETIVILSNPQRWFNYFFH